jgi:S1-C subfamily serine protease
VGDQLISISINGESKTITRQYQLIDTMVTARPGDEVQFTVVRDGQEQVLTVIVTEDCLTAY